MATGGNIKRIRKLKGMTQKELGMAIGFDQRTADVRMAQYETGTRTPKENYINALAQVLDVHPAALTTPDIDNYTGLIHTLFTLEDMYGLKIGEIDGEICLRLDKHSKNYLSLFDMFLAWNTEAGKLESGEITKEEYDHWRYNYPRHETGR